MNKVKATKINSFMRNFELKNKDANNFAKTMNAKAKPLFKNNFYSSFVELKNNHQLLQAIKLAVKH